jgi:acetyltransferase-like isoleucine patch superfamily enzyme
MIGLQQKCIIVAKGGNISIGSGVCMSGCTIYSIDTITIGRNTDIGSGCKIIDNDFHPIDPVARKNNAPQIPHKPVIIGNNVFIGMNSIILKGTVIGDNCVIGAGSVVHGKFEDNCIIAGNPARVVKVLESTKSAI